MPSYKTCSFPGCTNRFDSKGLCTGHRAQLARGDSLSALRQHKRHFEPPQITYTEQPCTVDGLEGPCHVFTRHKNNKGYGTTSHNGKLVYVHRYAWEQAKGPIPDGLQIDHRCRNRACCNVAHLRLVTPRINTIENSLSPAALHAKTTHCPRGHEYTADNTYTSTGTRVCRTCRIAKSHANYHRKQNEKKARNGA